MASAEPTPSEVWTIGRLLGWTREYLSNHSVDEPRLAAEILLADALSCKRIELYTRFDSVPDEEQLAVFRDYVKRAAARTPIAHLVGKKEFFSLEFEVAPDVLIPRPETEILAQQAIDCARAAGQPSVDVLDIGTGSGCVIVAVLTHLPTARGLATDVSAEALAVATRNAARHNLGDRLRFVEADLVNISAADRPADGFDIIVCNPPYVSAAEMETLDPGVSRHEPRLALTDGRDGLSFYRTLAGGGATLLKPGGSIFVEVADGQADRVRDIFNEAGSFEHTGTWSDRTGPHERVLGFRRRDA